MSEPMDECRLLLQRLKRVAEALGLEPQQLAITPSLDGVGADLIQAVFAITPRSVAPKDPERDSFDAQFAEIEEGLLIEIENDKADEGKQAAVEQLRDWLD